MGSISMMPILLLGVVAVVAIGILLAILLGKR
mgnify:CR=1 FL=1